MVHLLLGKHAAAPEGDLRAADNAVGGTGGTPSEEHETKKPGDVHIEVMRSGRFSRMGGGIQSIKPRATSEALAHDQDLT